MHPNRATASVVHAAEIRIGSKPTARLLELLELRGHELECVLRATTMDNDARGRAQCSRLRDLEGRDHDPPERADGIWSDGAGVVSGGWMYPLESPGSEYVPLELPGSEYPPSEVSEPALLEALGWRVTFCVLAPAWLTVCVSQMVMSPTSTAAAPAIHFVVVLT